MIDFGIIIKGFLAILESRASFIAAVALEVGFGVFLYMHPDNETYLFWVIVLGVALIIRGCFYWYDTNQSKKRREAKSRYIIERNNRARKEREEKELAEAKYVYDRLSYDSQNLLHSISRIAEKSTKEGSYIIKDKYENYQIIGSFENLLNNNFSLLDWIEYDNFGDSFTFTVKSPCLVLK